MKNKPLGQKTAKGEKRIAQIVMEHEDYESDCLDKDIRELLANQRQRIREKIEANIRVKLKYSALHLDNKNIQFATTVVVDSLNDILKALEELEGK